MQPHTLHPSTVRIMYRNSILLLIAASSLLIVLALPLYLKFIAYPAYQEFLVHNVEQEMKVLASQMVKGQHFPAPISQGSDLPAKFIKDVEYIQRTVGLPKIKIFSTEGIIVYSTDPADIGNRTSKYFFPKMMMDGLPRTDLKIMKSAGQTGQIQLIETYVPIIDQGVAVGAFEIYRDITGLELTFERMILDERKILVPVIILLLAGGLISSYLAYKSMAELKQARDQSQQLSVTDILTGLLNRRGFTTMAEKQLSILQRGGKGAFLLFIDMNDFKRLNDNYGHNAGDQALVEAAGILKNTLRNSDLIGRIGGDEFAALAVNGEHPCNQKQIRQRLVENLARWSCRKTVDYELSFSVGFVEYTPDSGLGVYELLSRADLAMYADKQRNKSALPAAY